MSKSQKSMIIPLLICGAIFFLIGLAMVPTVIEMFNFSKISSAGYLRYAVVEDIEYTTAQYNSQIFARAVVSYTDKDGQEQQGKTSYCFLMYKTPRIGSTIEIRELDGKIVEENFKPSDVYTVSCFITAAFGFVGLVMIIIVLGVFLKNHRRRKILTNGVIGTGTFVSAASNLMVNNRSVYTVTFSFKGTYGQEKVITTPARYYADEVRKLELMKKFEIYILDDSAVISQDLDKIDLNILEERNSRNEKYCRYCGKPNEGNSLNCKYCGGNSFTTKNRS